MRYNNLDEIMVKTYNKIDKPIQNRAGEPTEMEIYKARWVWYHTILACELGLILVVLICILAVVA